MGRKGGVRVKCETWVKQNCRSLLGKRVAVTGSTGGLGAPLCSYLASLGAELILLDRNEKKSAAHKAKLEETGACVTCISLDLENMDSVKRAADALIEHGVDVFLHNAGAYSIPRKICRTGYDNVFQINFVSPYYLIRRLLPHLTHIVAVGSVAHTYSHIAPDDIDFKTRTAASRAYGNAKRYLMGAMWGLAQAGHSVAVVHPGITFTNITAHYPKLIFALNKHPMKVIFMKPKRAALSILAGVFEQTGAFEWIGPKFFRVWGLPKKERLNTCKSDELAKILEISEQIYANLEETL